MFTNFSIMPLRLAAVVGLVFSFLGAAGAIGVIVEKLIYPDVPVGYPTIVVTVLTFSGIQLMVMGVAGEYVGRMFLAQNETPQFVVREFWGFAPKGQEGLSGRASGSSEAMLETSVQEPVTGRP
jgi:undecaprenyl-phosphate 4-deoxy-4-formamido-L-arabinose transferase